MTSEETYFRCKTCNEFLEGEREAYMHILLALGLSLTTDIYSKFVRKVDAIDRMRRQN